jgi:hypothetical protein
MVWYENKIVDKCSFKSFMFLLTNFVNFNLSISLWIIHSKTSMPKDIMVSKIFDCIVEKMGTLIGHHYQWTSKSCKDMFIQKLGSYCNSIGVECECFHPLCYIVSGHENVLIAWQSACRFNKSNKIQSLFFNWLFR